jgi:hypothetical protein
MTGFAATLLALLVELAKLTAMRRLDYFLDPSRIAACSSIFACLFFSWKIKLLPLARRWGGSLGWETKRQLSTFYTIWQVVKIKRLYNSTNSLYWKQRLCVV